MERGNPSLVFITVHPNYEAVVYLDPLATVVVEKTVMYEYTHLIQNILNSNLTFKNNYTHTNENYYSTVKKKSWYYIIAVDGWCVA